MQATAADGGSPTTLLPFYKPDFYFLAQAPA